MAKQLWRFYAASFVGLGPSSWFLAAVAFVNRAGTMVVPFLGLYLVRSLGLSPQKVSWILMAFGVGSVLGSMIGGKLVQRWGSLPVLIASLVLGGLAFVFVAQIRGYFWLLVGVFLIGLIGDAFRPAAMVAITETVEPELRNRSLALLRMAVNAGMAIGPAVGGWFATISYQLLFIGDAVACWLAALVLILGYRKFFGAKDSSMVPNEAREPLGSKTQGKADRQSAFASELVLSDSTRAPNVEGGKYTQVDWLFLAILFVIFVKGICFFQVIATKPLFLHEVYNLNEAKIGTIFVINGALIVPLEMVLFKALERKNPLKIYACGSILIGLALVVLPYGVGFGFAFVALSVIMWSFGEMLTMPFANAVLLTMAPAGKEGLYMGWYSATFSAAFLVAPFLGLQIYALAGWNNLWWSIGVASAVVAGTSWHLARKYAQSY